MATTRLTVRRITRRNDTNPKYTRPPGKRGWSLRLQPLRDECGAPVGSSNQAKRPPGVVTLEPATGWLHRLRDVVAQVIVTVNPHEFHGVAAATGLDSQVDLIVTSADARSTSKVVQAQQARRWLGLDEDLTSTLLVESKEADIAEFCEHGGQAVLFAENDTALDDLLLPLVS